MIECDRCGYYCRNNKSLNKHQKTEEYCSKYQDVIFVCRRCNFNTKGIKNIETHIAECNCKTIYHNSLSEVTTKQLVYEDKPTYIIKNSKLETKLKNKDIIIMNLQLRLQYEQIKNKVYANIIQTQTGIQLEDIIKESKNEINVYNFENGNIPVIVHDFINPSKRSTSLEDIKPQKYIIEPSVNKTKKNKVIEENDLIVEDEETPEEKHNDIDGIESSPLISKPIRIQPKFRRVKEYIKISEKELDTKLKEDVVRVEKELEEIVYNNFDVSHKEIIDNIEELFVQINTNRVYTANLFTMKELRRKLLGKINLEEYTSLILSHVKRLEDIFTNKNYNKKKINQVIHTTLTPLDTRLIYYEGYSNVIMDVDDVQKFGLALGVLVNHQKQFVPYDNKVFFRNIKNYGLSLFELQECIEKYLINIYGFHNIIYLNRNQIKNKKGGDPYSFYSLDTVKEHRYWKMECRLEDFTLDFIDNLLPYCINLFRKIYKDIFTDNVYRPDYMSKSQITEFDCEQLIQNIISLAKPNSLCKTIQQIIIDNCTFTTTETDKFNLYGDDKLQQKRLASAVDTDDDISKVFKRVFDGLSTEDALKLLYSKKQ